MTELPLRNIPSLQQLRRAGRRLPDPKKWTDDLYIVPVGRGSSEMKLRFRHIHFSGGHHEGEPRWIYDGKVMIRARDVKESKDDGSRAERPVGPLQAFINLLTGK